jgi:DNA repair and recombination protein RAD52
MFSDEQIEELKKPLQRSEVRERRQGNFTLSYVEGWRCVEHANRIFGFGNWNRETVDVKCVADAPRTIGQAKAPGHGVSYIARVRVTVRNGNSGSVVREGVGAGHGIDRDQGQAHESAIKEAETDAMKRALMTFGYVFGLALYDKDQEHVAEDEPAHTQGPAPSAKMADGLIAQMKTCTTLSALRGFGIAHRAEFNDLHETDRMRVNSEYKTIAAAFAEPEVAS